MTDPWSSAGTVAQLLDLRAARSPRAVAFQRETKDGRWIPISWQDFSLRVATLRRALYAAGLRKGDRLAIIASVSLEWELLHHAALGMGVVVVGMDAHDLPDRIADMVEQADVTAFASTDWRALSKLDAARRAGARLLLEMGEPGDRGGDWPAGPRRLTWAEFEASGVSADVDPERPVAGDIATIIFTSGTTGAPKGIAYRHEQLCLAIGAICEVFSFVGSEGRLLCWLPLSNLFQRIVNLAAVRQGVATYLLGDPRRVMEVVASVSPDIFIGVPRFYEKLYEGIRQNIASQPPLGRKLVEWAWGLGRRVSGLTRQGRVVPPWLALTHSVADRMVLRRVRNVMGRRLRCMVTGSAPTPRHLLEEFHALGWVVLEAYGLSENVLPMAMNRIDDFRFGTVGRPLPGNQIVVADDGAIKVRGPGVFAGYLGETDRSPFDGEGFYATGDLGQFDADGFLRLTGRSSELIKTSTGRRVAPASVEAQLCSVPGIDQAVLIGNGRKCLVALCTINQTGIDEPGRSRLQQALRERVGRVNEHERPSGAILIARPFSIERGELTPNLKVRRSVIERQYAELIQQLYGLIGDLERSTGRGFRVLLDGFEPEA